MDNIHHWYGEYIKIQASIERYERTQTVFAATESGFYSLLLILRDQAVNMINAMGRN